MNLRSGLNVKVMFLLAGGAISLLMLGTVALVWQATTGVLDSHHQTESLTHDSAAAREIYSSLIVQQALQAEYAITVDPEILIVFEETAETAFGRLDEIAERRAGDAEVVRIAESVRELDVQHDAIIFDQMVPALEAGDREAGLGYLADAQLTLDGLLDYAQELVDIFDSRASEAAAGVGDKTVAVRSTVLFAGLAMAVLVLCGLGGLYLALSRRLGRSAITLDRVRTDDTSADEIVRSHMAETSSEVDQIATACDSAAGDIEMISGSIAEMAAGIVEVSTSSTKAASVASSAVHRAERANTIVAQLDQSSGEIGQVVEVINSIAKQTNLLALNATIEAARAGESGKGFAVVANEVKELAGQTTASSDQIAQIVTSIQADTTESIGAIEDIQAIIAEIAEIQNTVAASVEEQQSVAASINSTADVASLNIGALSSRSEILRGSSDRLATLVQESTERSRKLEEVSLDLQRTIGTKIPELTH